MSHMVLYIMGKKLTTRDGTHPDDEEYMEQVKGQLSLRLSELGFSNASIELGWDDDNSSGA